MALVKCSAESRLDRRTNLFCLKTFFFRGNARTYHRIWQLSRRISVVFRGFNPQIASWHPSLLQPWFEYGLNNLHFVQDLFAETASRILREAERIALSHIDCDIYEAVEYADDSCKGHMISPGYIVFDDSTSSSCLGRLRR